MFDLNEGKIGLLEREIRKNVFYVEALRRVFI